jgi:predicted enzyme related to lactoylglutathione lyase
MMNTISWFEIPVEGFDRAKKFYEKMLGITIEEQDVGGALMGFLGDWKHGVSGALVKHEWYNPSEKGTLVYFNAGEDLNPMLTRAEVAGATVLMPKTKISDDVGYMAVLRDTEGNRIALHSPN